MTRLNGFSVSSFFILACSTQIALTQMITGTVVAAQSHKPVGGAVIALKDKKVTAITTADGNYVLDKVDPGVYTVFASKVHYFPAVQESVSSGQKANFELLEANLGSRRNQIIADLDELEARRLLPAAEAAGDVEAIFLLSNRLLVSHPEDASLKQTSQVAEGVLESSPAKISGAITYPGGEPVPNALVRVQNTITQQTVETKANSNGQYEVSVFPVGTYRVNVSSPQGRDTMTILPKNTVAMNADVTKDIRVPSIRF